MTCASLKYAMPRGSARHAGGGTRRPSPCPQNRFVRSIMPSMVDSVLETAVTLDSWLVSLSGTGLKDQP